MIERDEKLLAEFEIRMRQLMFLCDSLKEENASLKEELSAKDLNINSLTLEIEQLRAKYDNLKFVKSFTSGNNEDMMAAKNRLSKLVRDVDKCIALLKN